VFSPVPSAIVAFQMNFVDYLNGGVTTLSSGAGYIDHRLEQVDYSGEFGALLRGLGLCHGGESQQQLWQAADQPQRDLHPDIPDRCGR
jgi:hypothetical protein